MPSLVELTVLFNVLPELPPPIPRKRLSFAAQKALAQSKSAPTNSQPQPAPEPEMPVWRRLLSWTPFSASQKTKETPRINPFVALKNGKKMVVIGVVDAGTTTFFRFAQGAFEEWPMA